MNDITEKITAAKAAGWTAKHVIGDGGHTDWWVIRHPDRTSAPSIFNRRSTEEQAWRDLLPDDFLSEKSADTFVHMHLGDDTKPETVEALGEMVRLAVKAAEEGLI